MTSESRGSAPHKEPVPGAANRRPSWSESRVFFAGGEGWFGEKRRVPLVNRVLFARERGCVANVVTGMGNVGERVEVHQVWPEGLQPTNALPCKGARHRVQR